jgi:transcription elongation factor GreB
MSLFLLICWYEGSCDARTRARPEVHQKGINSVSRAFIKEDASNEQIIVPARAALPDGTPNLVTVRGVALLEAERAMLESEHAELLAADMEETDRARELAVNGERLAALIDRMASVELVRLPEGNLTEVVFGAAVTLLTLAGRFAGEERRFIITGVDEADAENFVAFTAPLVQAIMGRTAGDEVTLNIGSSEQVLKVVSVERPAEEA